MRYPLHEDWFVQAQAPFLFSHDTTATKFVKKKQAADNHEEKFRGDSTSTSQT